MTKENFMTLLSPIGQKAVKDGELHIATATNGGKTVIVISENRNFLDNFMNMAVPYTNVKKN